MSDADDVDPINLAVGKFVLAFSEVNSAYTREINRLTAELEGARSCREGVNVVTLVLAPFALVKRYTGDMIPYENGVTMDIVEGEFVLASDYDRLLMQLVRERQERWRSEYSHVG